VTAGARSALETAGSLGPFFAVTDAPEPDWNSWAELVGDPEPLRRRVDEVRMLLASGPGSPDVPIRVAASLVHLGLVARLLSPIVGAILAAGIVPVLPPRSVRLHLRGSNPLPMAFVDPSAVRVAGPADAARALDREWLVPLAGPLSTAVSRRYGVSPQVVEGNVASAVAGALRTATAARPELAGPADGVLDALLAEGSQAERGRRRDDGTFARRSCCLMYRMPGAGTCGDCVLASPPSNAGLHGRPAV
jgi:hypothetical protein